MTNWYSIFYWLTIADNVKHTLDIFSNWFMVFTIFFTIAYIIAFIVSQDNSITKDKDDQVSCFMWRKSFGRLSCWSFIIMTILWISWAVVPSKKDALIIIAGGAVGNFVTRDSSAKNIPSEVMLLLRTKIKEEINETTIKKAIDADTDTLSKLSREELIKLLKEKK